MTKKLSTEKITIAIIILIIVGLYISSLFIETPMFPKDNKNESSEDLEFVNQEKPNKEEASEEPKEEIT